MTVNHHLPLSLPTNSTGGAALGDDSPGPVYASVQAPIYEPEGESRYRSLGSAAAFDDNESDSPRYRSELPVDEPPVAQAQLPRVMRQKALRDDAPSMWA